ncbi:MAG: glycosyltransferase, partial [Anaerolineae bacterium]|nr:glycosyltransferase [Anaerolineae bacterium]
RPLHAFGGVGLALAVPGAAALGWLAFDKLVLGNPIGGRPLLLLGVLLVLMGVQLLATGVIAELIMRVYHEPQGHRQYLLRPPGSGARQRTP